MKKTIILFLTIFLISSCKQRDCKENNTGDLRMINNSSYQIEVTFNDTEVFMMEPDEEIKKELEPGDYTASVKFNSLVTLGYGVQVRECQKSIMDFEF